MSNILHSLSNEPNTVPQKSACFPGRSEGRGAERSQGL